MLKFLLDSAQYMEFVSKTACSGDYVSKRSCEWYHGSWQYLRILDMVSSPTWHSNFYTSEINKALKNKAPLNILISGTADYSMLAMLHLSLNENISHCNITILDLCKTPLIMCKWYADKSGLTITTIQNDILSLKHCQYDLIITDAFLTRFKTTGKKLVLKKWWELLSERGRVITTIRLAESLHDGSIELTPNQISEFKKKAYESAVKIKQLMPITPEEVARKAEQYATNIISYPITIDIIKSMFITAGFDFEQISGRRTKGEVVSTTYTEIVAIKKTANNEEDNYV